MQYFEAWDIKNDHALRQSFMNKENACIYCLW